MAAVSCGGTSARYRFIQKFGKEVSVRTLCLWLGVSRSGYYDWLKRLPSERALEDQALKTEIQKIYDDNEGRYGSPRLFNALRKQGIAVGKKRVERLQRELGLVARVVKVTRRAPGFKRFLASGENLRPEGYVPARKNEVWVADVTYLKVKNRWQYLSVVMDLYSRKLLSWSLDEQRTAEVTKRTLKLALKKRKPKPGLMIHTDRGVEYRGKIYQKELRYQKMLHSLSRPGKCTDNAHMESFFHTLKAELIRGNTFNTTTEMLWANTLTVTTTLSGCTRVSITVPPLNMKRWQHEN